MKGKYTYGDLIKAIQSFGIVATDAKINDLSDLSFKYQNMSLRMTILRKTFWTEEQHIADRKDKISNPPTTPKFMNDIIKDAICEADKVINKWELILIKTEGSKRIKEIQSELSKVYDVKLTLLTHLDDENTNNNP